MNKNFKNMSIGGIASVIAGAYYLYGSRDGEAKRKQISAWTLKMKGEVLEKIEKLKEVSEPKYKEIVKAVSAKYAKIDKGELKKVVDELHNTWNKMKKEVNDEIAKKKAVMEKENSKMKNTSKKVTPKAAVKKPATKVVIKKTPAVKSVKVKAVKEKPVEIEISKEEGNK